MRLLHVVLIVFVVVAAFIRCNLQHNAGKVIVERCVQASCAVRQRYPEVADAHLAGAAIRHCHDILPVAHGGYCRAAVEPDPRPPAHGALWALAMVDGCRTARK